MIISVIGAGLPSCFNSPSALDLDRHTSPVPPVEEEDDDPPPRRGKPARPKPLPYVDPLIVEYICSRFPRRVTRARELSATPSPYGVAYRDVLRLRSIGGALADLGIGTSKTERDFITVEVRGQEIHIHPDDVMVTLGMRPSTYRSVRSRMDKVQAVYTWLGQNKDIWEESATRKRLLSVEHRAFEAMKALFGPTPLPNRRVTPPEPHPAGIHDALWEPCATFCYIPCPQGTNSGPDLPRTPQLRSVLTCVTIFDHFTPYRLLT